MHYCFFIELYYLTFFVRCFGMQSINASILNRGIDIYIYAETLLNFNNGIISFQLIMFIYITLYKKSFLRLIFSLGNSYPLLSVQNLSNVNGFNKEFEDKIIQICSFTDKNVPVIK